MPSPRVFIATCFLLAAIHHAAAQDVETVLSRLREPLVVGPLNSVEAAKWLEQIGADERWPDVDYATAPDRQKAYAPAEHQKRCRALALMLAKQKGESAAVLPKLGEALAVDHKSVTDFGTRGRNITRPGNQRGVPDSTLQRLAEFDKAHAPQYAAWIAHNHGGPFPDPGSRHFWKSDFMVHRGAEWYASAKMISNRTTGTETMNGENLMGFNLPLGAACIMTHGSEYKVGGLQPVWDWSRIPGTTATLNDPAPSPHVFNGSNPFCGGASDNCLAAPWKRNQRTGMISIKKLMNNGLFILLVIVFCHGPAEAGAPRFRNSGVLAGFTGANQKAKVSETTAQDHDGNGRSLECLMLRAEADTPNHGCHAEAHLASFPDGGPLGRYPGFEATTIYRVRFDKNRSTARATVFIDEVEAWDGANETRRPPAP